MASLLALAGCSDDFEPQTPGRLDADGTLHLSFGISPMRKGFTRAVDQIGDVTMYVYDNDGGFLQKADLTVSGNTAKVLLNSSVTDAGANAKFYFVANPIEMEGNGNSLTALNGATFNDIEDESERFIMSSKAISYSDIENTVPLYHNAAKISVHSAKEDSQSEVGYSAGSETYAFVPQGTAVKSPVMAGGLNAASVSSGLGTPSATNLPTELSADEQFVHPTNNTSSGNSNKSWIIVQATNPTDNEQYYYRLDFQVKVEKTPATTPATYEVQAIDVRPNHHYEFLIKDIKGPGYKDIAQAAANPTPLLDYVIHDHAPVIYNMISDGSRELGVAKEKTRTETSPGNEIFYVKLFSPTASEMDEIKNSNNWASIFGINVDWLKVTGVEEITASNLGENETWEDFYGDSGVGVDNEGNPDTNSTGKVFRVKLQFSNTNNPGTLTTTIDVNWHGLSRSVDITWVRDFNTDNLFDPTEKVQLKIYPKGNENWNESGYDLYNKDYFGDFLKNKVQGVKIDDNNGQQRDNGLHFPMPYGNDENNKWTYIYKVKLNPDLGGGGDFSWNVTASGISSVKILIPQGSAKNKNDREFYITRSSSSNDFKYEKGKLILTITTNDGEVTYDNIALYHTGFFHDDDTTSAPDNSNDAQGGSNNKTYVLTNVDGVTSHPGKLNYYEVVTVGEGENTEYWLDRNMGASSAQSHILGGIENPQAQGYYMAAGYYWKYNAPIIFKNSVPPGYEVPSVEQWNKLKNASNFNIEQVGSYYYPTLRVGDKEIYFPKGKYYNNTVQQGENRAGYYWTRDAATGTEKDETGSWLKCMQFAGTSSSYMNGRTMGRDGVDPYYMSLRAVAKSNSTVKHPEKFYFLVKGATHVYLYKGEGKDRVAAFSWPGKAIGNYSTSNKTYSFSYETTTSSPEELMVIFNFVDDKGRVYTMSKNVFNDTDDHYSINPDDARGWNVIGSKEGSDFTAYTDCGVSISAPLDSDNKSQNGTLWTCNSGFVVPDPPKPPFSYGVVWPKSKGGQLKILDIEDNTWITSPDDTFIPSTGDGWTNNDGYQGAYYYDGKAPESSRGHKVKIYVTNGTSTWVTKTELKIDNSGWNRKMLYDNDFQLEGGSGEENTNIFKLRGQITGNSDWEDIDMTKNADGTWSVTKDFVKGKFGVKENNASGTQVGWYAATDNNSTDINGAGTYSTMNASSYNFNLTVDGNFTFTFDPSTSKLTITGSGSGSNETIYRVYWYKGDSASRDKLNYWSSDSNFWGKQPNQGSEYPPNHGNECYYYDIKVPNDKNLTYLNCNAYNESNQNYHPQNGTNILSNPQTAPADKPYDKYYILY